MFATYSIKSWAWCVLSSDDLNFELMCSKAWIFKASDSSRNPSLGARDRNWESMLHNSTYQDLFSELAFPLKRESEASISRM